MLLLAGKEDKEPSADVPWSSGFEAQDHSFPACAQQCTVLHRANMGSQRLLGRAAISVVVSMGKDQQGPSWAAVGFFGCLLFEGCLGQSRSPQSWTELFSFVIGGLSCPAEQGRRFEHLGALV